MEQENKIIVQKLRRKEKDVLSVAERYYSILFAVNGIHLTEREIQLISFTAVKSNISYKHWREEFCEKYKSSFPTMNNIISKLKRMGILIKDNAKIKVSPIILLDFNKNISLQINISNG